MEQIIKNFIIDTLLYQTPDIEIKNETPLFSSGIINSMGFLQLISFLEKTFEISIDIGELDIESFNSIYKITSFIKIKKGY